jgi:tripartite ATP-independent transporter DctP family solute receptor
MNTVKKWLVCLNVIFFVFLGVSANTAASETLRFGHVYSTDRTDHLCALAMAKEIARRTNGRYKIEVFPNSSLGSESALHEGLSIGTVNMSYEGTAFLASAYTPLGLTMAPFVFRDYAHWKAFIKSDLFRELIDGYYEKTGNKIVSAHYQGAWHVLSNKPITKPRDMKGLKMRVPNAPMYLVFPRAVEANPAPIAYSEAYLALKQGVVDIMDQGLGGIKQMKFYEVAKYINMTGHLVSTVGTVIGGPAWNKLSDADKKIFSEVITAESEKCSDQIREDEKQLLKEYGGSALTINEVDHEAFVKALKPSATKPGQGWTKAQYEQLLAIE